MSDVLVVIDGVIFGVEVPHVCRSWGPKNMELLLVHAILYPVEAHVNCFRADLFASFVGNGDCGGVVDLDWCRWLGVAHFV